MVFNRLHASSNHTYRKSETFPTKIWKSPKSNLLSTYQFAGADACCRSSSSQGRPQDNFGRTKLQDAKCIQLWYCKTHSILQQKTLVIIKVLASLDTNSRATSNGSWPLIYIGVILLAATRALLMVPPIAWLPRRAQPATRCTVTRLVGCPHWLSVAANDAVAC
jgi:hypothetical protein